MAGSGQDIDVPADFASQYNIDDLVCLKVDSGKRNVPLERLGIVLATEEDSGSEEEECEQGEVIIDWLDLDKMEDLRGMEQDWDYSWDPGDNVRVTDIALVDRSFLVGDTVQYFDAAKGESQVGIVTKSRMVTSVRTLNGDTVRDVPDSQLEQLTGCNDDAVLKGSWVGRITEALYFLKIKLENGTHVYTNIEESEQYFDVDRDQIMFPFSSVYQTSVLPGQKGVIKHGRQHIHRIEEGKPLPKARGRGGRYHGEVVDIVAEANIDWIVSNPCVESVEPMPPSDDVRSEDWDRWFAPFQRNNMQAGDIVWWNPHPDENADPTQCEPAEPAGRADHDERDESRADDDKGDDSRQSAQARRRDRNRRRNQRRREARRAAKKQRQAVIIDSTQTFIDVLWQDGTTSENMPGRNFWSRVNTDDHEYVPQDLVALVPDVREGQATISEDDPFIQNLCYTEKKQYKIGVIDRAVPEDRTAFVRWMTDIVNNVENVEEMSVYDLTDIEPDSRDSWPGCAVVINHEFLKDQTQWFGYISAVNKGRATVRWSDDTVSEVWQGQLVNLTWGDEFGDDFGDSDSDSDSDSGWMTEYESSASEEGNQNDNTNNTPVVDISEQGVADGPGLALQSGAASWWSEEGDTAHGLGLIPDIADMPSTAPVTERETPSDAPPETAAAGSRTSDAPSSYGIDQFAILDEAPKSHAFVSLPNERNTEQNKALAKVLRKEHKLLTTVPPGVYVRTFADRSDLFRVAILGPDHTPYHDAMFVFDVKLPSDYPSSPPEIEYLSQGPRLNPNLYENGTVCLSLLGTWTGDGVEEWQPGKSNMLQVLLSIQGLVLVPEPYFNEAGYEKFRGSTEGAANSVMYNETSVLHSLRKMIKQLHTPVETFEELSTKHYAVRLSSVIERVEGILDRAGSPDSVEVPDAGIDRTLGAYGLPPKVAPSRGFAIALKRVLARLKEFESGAASSSA